MNKESTMLSQDVFLELKAAAGNVLKRPAVLIGFIAAVVGPFALLVVGVRDRHNLPWSFWAIGALLLLAVIVAGFVMFTRDSDTAKEISISPDRR